MSMTYYMVKVIKTSGYWYFNCGENYAGRKFIRFQTPWWGIAFVFSSGNAHYLREETKQEQEKMKEFEKFSRECPKKKNGDPDMRYKVNKVWNSSPQHI